MSSEEANITYAKDHSKLANDYLYRAYELHLYSDIVEIDQAAEETIEDNKLNESEDHELRDKTEEFFDSVEFGFEVFVAARMITEEHPFLTNFNDLDQRFFLDFAISMRISQIENMLKLEDTYEEYYGKWAGEYPAEEQLEFMRELADLQELQNHLRERVSPTQAPERK